MISDRQPSLFDIDEPSVRSDPLHFEIPLPFRPHLRIGTCSWKYDSWRGLIYDRSKKYCPDDYLIDYARHFSTVEIDQWFWSLFPSGVKLPSMDVAKQYADNVPDYFRFTVKAPNAITLTHHYSKQPKQHADFADRPNERFLDVNLLNRFLERLAPMGDKLGPIMFQFEYLNKAKMPSREAFLEHLDRFFGEVPSGFRYAVETRNPNYLSSEFLELLEEHDIGFVFLEGYHMPHIGDVWDNHEPATTDFSIIRLHGSDRSGIETRTGKKWNQIVEPQPNGLTAAARIVRANVAKKVMTYVNVNNHFEGSAPLTIERLLGELIQLGDE